MLGLAEVLGKIARFEVRWSDGLLLPDHLNQIDSKFVYTISARSRIIGKLRFHFRIE